MSADDDGLWVTVRTTPAGGALLQANPRLGVSARIVEQYQRSDGKFFPAAIQHVLGTLDPRIPALGDWQPVDLANGYGQALEMVIDLSNSQWAGEPGYDFADTGDDPDDEHQALAASMRRLATKLGPRHPELGTAQHVDDAADAVEDERHDGAVRHLNAAIETLTPTSLRRHGLTDDDDHNRAKRSMDEINRHVLLVKDLRDGQGQDDDATGLANDDAPGGLSDRGSSIYKKLCAKGVRPAVALAMAKRAQAKAAGAKQFANDEYGYLPDPGELIGLAHAQAARREAEDAARPMRRATGTAVTEDRLQAALGRIGRGTYTPTQPERALGFAAGPDTGPLAGTGCTCGGPGETRYHFVGCPEVELSPDMTAEMMRSDEFTDYTEQQATDASGRTWLNQHGQPMDMTQLIEAATGERLTPLNGQRGLFETGQGRREMITAQRVSLYGDYDDPDDPGREFGSDTMATARAAAAQWHLAPHRTADEAREQGRRLQAAQRLARGQRPGASDETARERAERYRQPFGTGLAEVGWDDGNTLPGELVGLTYG